MQNWKKLLEEYKKYGAVTCSICHKRKRKNWNIYSANTFCSEECKQRAIDMLCGEAYKSISNKKNMNKERKCGT